MTLLQKLDALDLRLGDLERLDRDIKARNAKAFEGGEHVARDKVWKTACDLIEVCIAAGAPPSTLLRMAKTRITIRAAVAELGI
ncbi:MULTISPECIES: hypothetical protein [unclassified Mesorhizobium]|uniref:hypothetical protein n=1 Tax=unclassified Mesorhizobium TaxID=325217 RepID=UPI0010941114|nr:MULTISPECIES: hypothetical protein [unclassified Mesorhizobium]TGS46021.1 hypothetical protein EN825_10370 [Mesorhizobium sp. M8A.F.Ca.ET.182.01.1.1]TGS81476.1 hypothetical protein EN824_10585 [Mesorhizobium sp. M8A.F.Ca.ET.181.01.1.1]